MLVTELPILLDSLLLELQTAVATAALRSERSTKKEATEEYRSSRTLKKESQKDTNTFK